jgi:amino acid permease
MKERDYSIIVRKILGKKWEIILNIFLMLYVLLFLMTYTTLIYSLIGRFIRAICYKGQYETFDDFKKDKWDKAYYKWPIIFGYCIILFSISLFRNMEKLNFAGYIGFGAVLYTSVVVVIQCKKYYNWYYNNERIEGDKSTYPNYWDFGKAFTKDLNFFKGMASLFAAYTNHSNCFPIYSSFDGVKDGKKKMIHSIYLSNIIVGLLHCAVIICAFLTEPLEPEDLIIFRINRFGGYDIVMNIAILSSAVCLFFSTPLYFVGLRMVIINTFFGGVLTTKLNLLVLEHVLLFLQ